MRSIFARAASLLRGIVKPNAACLDCGIPYGGAEWPGDLLLPTAQWLMINPQGRGVLCASCILLRVGRLPHASHVMGRIVFADDYSVEWDRLNGAGQREGGP